MSTVSRARRSRKEIPCGLATSGVKPGALKGLGFSGLQRKIGGVGVELDGEFDILHDTHLPV